MDKKTSRRWVDRQARRLKSERLKERWEEELTAGGIGIWRRPTNKQSCKNTRYHGILYFLAFQKYIDKPIKNQNGLK